MAELSTRPGKNDGRKSTRRRSTKIDMTAMVDVAFLLLTFFVLTATMSSQGVKFMIMPPDPEDHIKIIDNKIMTIVLDDDDRVLSFVGVTDIEVDTTNYASSGIRQRMLEFLKPPGGVPRCDQLELTDGDGGPKACWDPIIVVKAKPTARYQNLVDILDELSLIGAPKYTIAEFTPADSVLLALSPETLATNR